MYKPTIISNDFIYIELAYVCEVSIEQELGNEMSLEHFGNSISNTTVCKSNIMEFFVAVNSISL